MQRGGPVLGAEDSAEKEVELVLPPRRTDVLRDAQEVWSWDRGSARARRDTSRSSAPLGRNGRPCSHASSPRSQRFAPAPRKGIIRPPPSLSAMEKKWSSSAWSTRRSRPFVLAGAADSREPSLQERRGGLAEIKEGRRQSPRTTRDTGGWALDSIVQAPLASYGRNFAGNWSMMPSLSMSAIASAWVWTVS